MRVSKRALVIAFALLSILAHLSHAAAQESDQAVAERILGPQWKQLSRRAAMIFAGTVLTTAAQTVAPPSAAPQRALPGATPAIQLSFHVDRAIAGVEPGQTLTIHEWAGAWSRHRPMRSGEHLLLFLYPPSRLGLTSPVGGSSGLFVLDAALNANPNVPLDPSGQQLSDYPPAATSTRSASIVQLERAIRSARSEEQ